eukprot:gene7075-11055_t
MSLSIFLLIFTSILVFCVESHPMYYKRDDEALVAIETACVMIFTAELAIKLLTTEDRRAFCKQGLNWIDFVSILPYYVDLIVAS